MNKQKNLQINILLNIIKSVMTVIFPLITYKYASTVLMPSGIGKYNYASSIISYFQMIATLGINTYAITEGSKIRDNSENFKLFTDEVFSLNILTTLISYALLIIFILFNYESFDIKLLFICSWSVLLNTFGLGWICNIFEDFAYITIRTIGIQGLSLVLLFLFVKSPEDLYKYVIISTFSSSGWNLFNFFYVRKYVKISIKTISGDLLRKHIKPILLLFSASASSTIYMNADKTMIGAMLGDSAVGLYTSAVKIITVVTTIVVAIREVFLPQIANNLANNDNKDANILISNGLSLIIKFIIPCMIGIFITADDLIIMISSDAYMGAGQCLRILSIELLFSPVNAFVAYQVLVPKEKTYIVAFATAVAAAVNIILNLWFIPIFGIDGAALTTVISEIIVFAILIFMIRKYISISFAFIDLPYIIISCFPILIFDYIIPDYLNVWIRECIIIFLSALSYLLILFIVFKRKISLKS